MTPDAGGAPDRFRFSTLAHVGRALLGPLSEASVDSLLAIVRPAPPAGARAAVLDVGCGKGEILVRAMERLDAIGTGVDPNPAFLADARARAAAAGRGGELALVEATLADAHPSFTEFDLAICTGAAHAFGDLDAALAGLAALVCGHGWALVGHGYWRRDPDPAYLAAFGGRADELEPLDAVLAAPARRGWTLAAHHASTFEEWDAYEHAYAEAMRAWLAAHPDDAEAPAFRERIESWAAAYERWGRDTMGFVTMVLRR